MDPFRLDKDFNGRLARCRIRIFEAEGQAPVMIATKLEEQNPGMSLTNAKDRVAYRLPGLFRRTICVQR